VSEWLDTNALLIGEVKSVPNIYLPKAQTGNPELNNAVIIAANVEEFDDEEAGPRFITSITSVVRYHERKNWDYDDGEIDYARYTNFISKLARQAEKHFISKGSLLSREGIKPVAHALLIGARILNLPGASANTDAENLSAMLFDAPTDAGVSGEPQTPWQRLRFGTLRSRNELRSALLSLVSARQGTGEKIHAIDSTPLLEAISELRAKRWVLESDPTPHFNLPSQGLKEHLRQLRNTTPVTQRADEIISWADQVTEAFGKDFETTDLVANMRSTITEARAAGVFRCRTKEATDFLPRLKDGTSFGTIRDHLTKAEKLRENRDKYDVLVSNVSQVDDSLMERISTLIADYQIFLADTESTVAGKLQDVPSDLDDTTAKLRSELELLAACWEGMTQNP
jgi:hypothetical protein